MSTFIPADPAALAAGIEQADVEAPAAPPAEPPVTNDGFFPDIDPVTLREAYRIRDAVTPARLREAIITSIITAGDDLAAWAASQKAAGYATLGEVPSPQVGGKSRLVALYGTAIGSYTRAQLVERQADMDLTGQGQRQVSDLADTPAELRRDAVYAIRAMLGVGRQTIELL
ncbi:head completion/stabilization protein [Sphingomonas oryzagri]|uniref:Head completion/stabilization protein n=1 Tax=Sphingomonas oryzagri TaxID=3042314 RepID=A0ABT6N7T8_9SPHN|nr:head completion/stabilization protein [Sphingomonas oryzagri]MDH7641187.1 head completion/stabilization protein [Sphingomonas oryzagri]